MEQHIRENIGIACKGFLGLVGTGTGVTVSLLSEVELWLRLLSLAGAFTVSVVTVWSILRNNKPK